MLIASEKKLVKDRRCWC